MTRHLQEAIALNLVRLPMYAELSYGRSIPISHSLIRLENNLRLSAKAFDILAYPYQLRGIPILCEDFMDMALTSAFRYDFADGAPRPVNFHRPNLKTFFVKAAGQAILHQFGGIEKAADELVRELEIEPRYNCLTRHFLESIRRSAGVAMKYRKGTWISSQFILGQLLYLKRVVELDELAEPLQSAGLPIFCQDVPHIPAVDHL